MMKKSQFFFFPFRKPSIFTYETHCKAIRFKAKAAETEMCQDIYRTAFMISRGTV